MTEEPIRVPFKRWRHKARGFIVHVVSVVNYQGKHGYYTTVVVRANRASPVGVAATMSWPGEKFLAAFEPAGRRIRRLTRWQRLDQNPGNI